MIRRALILCSLFAFCLVFAGCSSLRKGSKVETPSVEEPESGKGYWMVGGEDDAPEDSTSRDITIRIPDRLGEATQTTPAPKVATTAKSKAKPKASKTSKEPAKKKDGAPTFADMERQLGSFKQARVGEYLLEKGDAVIIHLQGIPTPETVEDIVDANGTITLPLIDSVQASGMSSRQVEASIKGKYTPDYYRSINVTVLVPTKSYYVEGKVSNPGKFELRGVVKVMQAIAESGGATEFAHPWKVSVTRGDQVIELDRRKLKERPSADVELLPGDRVNVHENWF